MDRTLNIAPRYSTTDHWIQESIKRIFSSGLFWAVGGCREKQNPNCHKYATFEASFFMFSWPKKHIDFFLNIVASALKSYIG